MMLRQTLRDLKNGEPPKALADKLHDRGIVFVHVPKCAGSSVEKALRARYRVSRKVIDPETSFSAAVQETGFAPSDDTRHEILCRASEIRRTLLHYYLAQGVKCITGHAPLGRNTIDTYDKTHHFVTVLRDPKERYLSHLAYNLDGDGGHGRIDEGLSEFLERPRARMMGALYTKYFSGLPMKDILTSAKGTDRAKAMLEKFAIVGFTDAMDDFAGDLTCLTSHNVEIGAHNLTPLAAREKLSLSSEAEARIDEFLEPDQAIYDWARQNWFVDLKTPSEAAG